MRSTVVVVAAAAAVLAGCGHPSREAALGSRTDVLRTIVDDTPAVFVGTLRDPGGPDVVMTLVLRADSLYIARTRYKRSDSLTIGRIDELGTWRFAPDSSGVILSNGRGTQVVVPLVSPRVLVVPRPGTTGTGDTSGRTMHRVSALTLTPRLRLIGVYDRGTGRVLHCESGREFAFAADGHHRSFVSALSVDKRARGMIDVEAVLEGSQLASLNTDTIVVVQFNGLNSGDRCIEMTTPKTIFGPTWQLIEEHGRHAPASGSSERHPHLTVDSASASVAGMAGCNRFGGRARVEGGRVRFSELVMTKMACDQLELEGRFSAALEEARTWRIVDNQLELLDAAGAIVARFVSLDL